MGSGVTRIVLHLTACRGGVPPSLMETPSTHFEPGYLHSESVCMRLTPSGGADRTDRGDSVAITPRATNPPTVRIVRTVRMAGAPVTGGEDAESDLAHDNDPGLDPLLTRQERWSCLIRYWL